MRAMIAVLLLAAGCSQPSPEPVPEATPAPVETPAVSNATVAEAPPAEPDKTQQGAVAAADAYLDLLRAGDYARAWGVWPGPDGGVSQDDFVQRYARYSSYDAKLGAPGLMEGAAGSIYLEIPVTVTAALKSGGTEQLAGTVVMRRVNDVDGSTLAQRTWHINSIELK
jgi:hypothetical protein